jgi:hypothetical protein
MEFIFQLNALPISVLRMVELAALLGSANC